MNDVGAQNNHAMSGNINHSSHCRIRNDLICQEMWMFANLSNSAKKNFRLNAFLWKTCKFVSFCTYNIPLKSLRKWVCAVKSNLSIFAQKVNQCIVMSAKTRKITLKLFLLVKSSNGILVCQNFTRLLQMHASIFVGREKDTNTDAKKTRLKQSMNILEAQFPSSVDHKWHLCSIKFDQFTLSIPFKIKPFSRVPSCDKYNV